MDSGLAIRHRRCLHRAAVVELIRLLDADHDNLERTVWDLLETRELKAGLDLLQLAFSAHAEAEAIILRSVLVTRPPPQLATTLERVLADHVEQERAIVCLLAHPVGTAAWRAGVLELQVMMQFHATHERDYALPALRDLAPPATVRGIASTYATERLRALGVTRSPLSDQLPAEPATLRARTA